jgi:hypothetical protein
MVTESGFAKTLGPVNDALPDHRLPFHDRDGGRPTKHDRMSAELRTFPGLWKTSTTG